MAELKNQKFELFCRYYITEIDGKLFHATRAAEKAGYSQKTAYSQGQRLLKKVEIRQRIGELKKDAMNDLEIDALYVLQKYKKIVEDDISNYLEFESVDRQLYDNLGNALIGENGEPMMYKDFNIAFQDSKKIDTWNITEVSRGRDGAFKFKLHAKDKALEKLAEYIKLFEHDEKSKVPAVILIDDLPGDDL